MFASALNLVLVYFADLSYKAELTLTKIPLIKYTEGHFTTSTRLSWSTEESVVIRVTANYRNDVETFLSFGTELITPFADWKRTALELG